MRKISILLLLLLIAASCATSQANQPTAGRGYTLTSVSPPHGYGDIDRKSLREAIQSNLSYLERLDKDTRFNYGGRIVRVEEVVKTHKTLLRIMDTVESKEMLEFIMGTLFEWYKASGVDGKGTVVFTGYYIPEVEGSLFPTEKYRYPLYMPPDDLKQDQSYYTRKEIDGKGVLRKKGLEIAWLADPVEAYFLHIQGSGTIRLPDGSKIGVHYADNNGHSYVSIGKLLINQEAIRPEEGSLIGIKRYLWSHPDQMDTVLDKNPRYIFFNLDNSQAKGSLQVPLTPGHSIATDPALFPRGGVSFIKTTVPVVDPSGAITGWREIKRFVLNQDEGGGIKGPGRVDIFWGGGPESGIAAGSMKERGELYFLIQR